MCGIYGIIYKTKQTTNYQEIIKDTYTGLQQLVHRGKDGFGFSWVTTQGKFYESKKFGELTRFQYSEIITYPMTQIQSCIGHTRYSTSGNSLNVKESIRNRFVTGEWKDSSSSSKQNKDSDSDSGSDDDEDVDDLDDMPELE